MEIFKYIDRLKKHNWNYRNINNNNKLWQIYQKEHAELIKISFTSPDHRRAWLKYKKENENG